MALFHPIRGNKGLTGFNKGFYLEPRSKCSIGTIIFATGTGNLKPGRHIC